MVFSVTLFTLACVLAFYLLLNGFSEGQEFTTAIDEASLVGEFIIDEGTRADWNKTNYMRPGFISYGKLNQTKINWAMQLSNESYSAIKSSYGLKNDFLAVIYNNQNLIIPFSGICGFGKQNIAIDFENITGGCNNTKFTELSYQDLAKVTRYAAYNGTIVKVVIYSWY